jgi:hypothetical protein
MAPPLRGTKPAPRSGALGLRTRTARAIAVLLLEGDDGLEVAHRGELATFDPTRPDSKQPHHAGLGLDARAGAKRVAAAERAVRRAARRNLDALLRDLAGRGFTVEGVAVVGAPVADPARIGNEHVRAHAAEGQLFRDVLSEAAAATGLDCALLDERTAWPAAAERLRCGESALKRQVADLGSRVGPPWRADEKLACLGALLHMGGR